MLDLDFSGSIGEHQHGLGIIAHHVVFQSPGNSRTEQPVLGAQVDVLLEQDKIDVDAQRAQRKQVAGALMFSSLTRSISQFQGDG